MTNCQTNNPNLPKA